MSFQAGQTSATATASAAAASPATSTATGPTSTDGAPHPAPQTLASMMPTQFSNLDIATQQAILQQLAAARGAGNPAAAAFFANLNLQRRTSGPTQTISTAAPPPAALASAPSPSTSINAPSPSAPGHAPDVAALQAQLQARLLHAQQQAIQAAAIRQANAAGSPAASVSAAQSPAADTTPRPPAGLPEWAAAAAASGMLSNLGTDREAIMKQALHQSQQNRAKHTASLGVGSPINPSAPSPASMAAPSPAAGSVTAPSPSGSASAPTPIATSFLPEPSAPSPGIMAALARPGATPTPTTPTATGLPAGLAGMANTVRPGMPVRPAPFIQKQQLLNSLIAFYKTTNQTLPPEVFNGEHDGAFKLGGVWIELTDLFLAVFRLGGLIKLMQTSHPHTPNPADHPVWQHILVSKGVPLTLSAPVQLPKQPGMDPNAPPQMTTNSVQYLVAGYRAWIFGFEQAMARTKLAAFQKQQQQAAVAAGIAGTPSLGNTPATPTAPGPPVGMPTAATPTASAPTPDATRPNAAALLAALVPAAPSPQVAPSPQASLPPPTPLTVAPTPPAVVPTPPAVAAPSPVVPVTVPTPSPVEAVPAPSPKVEIPASSADPSSQAGTPAANGTPGDKQKRKRDATATPSTPTAARPAHNLPKRPRYRVEYRPLHFPHPMMGGWDERTITTGFSKYMFGRPAHVAQELQIDVEAVLMGLRSRLPVEIGYGMTALSMLSMPLHDSRMPYLPIEPLTEVYLELLDLIAESALGEGGINDWLEQQRAVTPELSTSRSSVSREHIERMTYAELEQLGNDVEYCVEEESTATRDHTGGKTEMIFAGLNMIRNFSMLPDNQTHMARPELFNVLAAITDKSLMRLPGEQSDRPYSVLEYARVCRDAVSIVANLGGSFNLTEMPKTSVRGIFRLVASFLMSAWEVLQKREPGFGPNVSIREAPPTTILSIDRALEAFCRLVLPDNNREVVAAVIPSDELVELFESLVKLFPISMREVEALRSMEAYLARVELIALSVYSLAFLAPQHARSGMRTTSGATAVMTRLVYGLSPLAAEAKGSPFSILVRRVAETLGVLNGTVTPGGNAQGMSFSAGGIDGKGWKFNSDAVEPGWLAHDADRVFEAMGWGRGDGRIWRMDGPTFTELDGLWSV